MPRTSKKAERTEEILRACFRCVARYGVEGSTLERIAEEAGLRRSLVRHFVGNRDELMQKMAHWVIEQSNQQWDGFLQQLPKEDAVPWLLEGLFGSDNSDAEFTLVMESLIFSAGRDPELKQLMQDWFHHFVEGIRQVLQQDYPNIDVTTLQATAFGIISLYFNVDSLTPLGKSEDYRQLAYQAAKQLLIPLEKPKE